MLENVSGALPADLKDNIMQNTVVSGGMACVSALVGSILGETKYCITESPDLDCYVGLQVISQLEGGFITKAMWEEQGEALWAIKK